MKLTPPLAGLFIFAAGALAAIADDSGPLPGTKPLTIEGDLSAPAVHEPRLAIWTKVIADSIESRPGMPGIATLSSPGSLRKIHRGES